MKYCVGTNSKKRFIFITVLLMVAFTVLGAYADEQDMTPMQWLEKGKTLAANKDLENAILAYSQAIQLDAQFGQAYAERGKAYISTKQFGLAAADFTKTIELDPQNGDLYWLRGIAYAGKGEHILAIEEYNKTLRINPKMYLAYWTSALSYEKMGSFYFAIQAYENFLNYATPDYPNIEEAKKRLNRLKEMDKNRINSNSKAVEEIGLQNNYIFDFLNTDYLRLTFDKTRWKIGFQQRADNGFIIEFVTGNETVTNWTELITVQFFPGIKHLSPKQYATFIEEHYRDIYGDKGRVSVIRASNTDALVEYKVSGHTGVKDEHTITRIIKGKASLILVHYAAKPTITAEKRVEGLAVLNGVQYFDNNPLQ